MLSYLEKFNSLPAEIRNKISSPQAMTVITELESRFGISLAAVIMRVMVKDISLLDLEKYFVFEHNLTGPQAKELVRELNNRVFVLVADYLGIVPETEEKEEAISEPKEEGGLGNWMDKRRREAGVRSSDFFFSSEDEEEVKQLAEKVQGFEGVVPKVDNAPEVAGQTVKELDYNFSSQELGERFKKILITYIKGVRKRLDTKQTLLKSIEEGGLGLNDVLAGKALDIADKKKEEFINKEKKKSEEPEKNEDTSKPTEQIPLPDKDAREKPALKPDGASDIPKEVEPDISGKPDIKKIAAGPASFPGETDRDVAYDFDALEKKKTDDSQKIQSKPESKIKKEEVARQDGTEEKKTEKSAAKDEKRLQREAVLDLTEHKEKEKHAENFFNVKRTFKKKDKNDKSGKIKMEDVKHVPKLMGPIDELKEMDLERFRRLEDDPKAAVKKIQDKISFLEEDGYGKKLAGIKAWRQSPLNKIYLQIGQEAIKEKKGINIVIDEKRDSGQDCISEIEFSAIMDLNKKLRF